MKIVRNKNYYNSEEQYTAVCSKYNKEATITVFYRAPKLCKTDIQPTLIESGRKCSLCDENKSICLECPIAIKRY